MIGSNIFPILQTDLWTFNVSGKYSSYFRYQPIVNTSPADGSLSLQSLILLSDTDWGVMTVISTRWHYVCNFTDRSPRHTQDAILQSFDLLFCLSGSNFDSVCPKKDVHQDFFLPVLYSGTTRGCHVDRNYDWKPNGISV